MSSYETEDQITIVDETGLEKDFQVDALFDMENQSYALLSADNDDMLLMRIEEDQDHEQYLVDVSQEEIENILAAYHIALDADIDDPELLH